MQACIFNKFGKVKNYLKMWVPEASCGSWITEGMQVGEAVVLSEDVYILNMPGGYLHIYLKRLNFAQSLYFLRRRNSLHWLNHNSKCSFCVVVPVVYNSSFEYLIIIELFQKPIIYSLQHLLPVEFTYFCKKIISPELLWDMQKSILDIAFRACDLCQVTLK